MTDQTRKKEFYSGVTAQCRPRRYNSEPAERSGSSDQLTDTASGDPSWDESWVFATADDPGRQRLHFVGKQVNVVKVKT